MNNKQNFFRRIILPVIRATAKALPISSTLVNAMDEINTANKEGRPPQKVVELIVEILIASGLVWALLTKTITIEDFINLLKN